VRDVGLKSSRASFEPLADAIREWVKQAALDDRICHGEGRMASVLFEIRLPNLATIRGFGQQFWSR
jgi:hypothetical protein